MEPQFQEIDGKRFVKVRVPVIVDADGLWVASSNWSNDKDDAANDVAGLAGDLNFDHVRRIHFLYAPVPVPDADPMPIIGAEVEPAN